MPTEHILMLAQAVIVIGGGFYFAGTLGAKLDALTVEIRALNIREAALGVRVNEVEKEVATLHGRLDAHFEHCVKDEA